MTYDYTSLQQPGPNAPLPWVLQNADAFASAADRWGDQVLCRQLGSLSGKAVQHLGS